MIFQSVDEFLTSPAWCYIQQDRKNKGSKLVVTSGGFSVLHVGHVRCIRESAQIASKYHGHLVVLVNGDGFLQRKKGNVIVPLEERLEIIDGIAGVDHAVGWDDGSQTVVGALEKLCPNYFTKGGDRSEPSAVPEYSICQAINCQILFGVGGADKIQSSSNLISKIQGQGQV